MIIHLSDVLGEISVLQQGNKSATSVETLSMHRTTKIITLD